MRAIERHQASIKRNEIMTHRSGSVRGRPARGARKNIPAGGNPYQDGSQQHALWAAGHEQVAGETEAGEAEGSSLTQSPRAQPIFFRPFLKRGPLR